MEKEEKKVKKASIKKVLIEAGLVVPTAVAGGLLGATMGRPSLGVGIGVVLGGAYVAQKFSPKYGMLTMVLGATMLATMGMNSQVSATEGLEGVAADAKDRAINFLKGLGRKAYLDKSAMLSAKLGLGDAEYYNGAGNIGEPDTSEIDRIIAEVAAAKNGQQGVDAQNLQGIDAMALSGAVDAQELNPLLKAAA